MKCQTAYLYVLMSNNDQVAANQPVSAAPMSCRGGRMFAFYLHKNRANKSDERITKPFDLMTNTEQEIFKLPNHENMKIQRKVTPADRGTLQMIGAV